MTLVTRIVRWIMRQHWTFIAGLLSGAVVTESVFAIPGLGRLAVDAIATRDYPIIQALIILIGTFYVFINLAVDIAYAVLDPRIRY